MNLVSMIGFAAIAALGNALFALGQRQSAGVANGLLFVAVSAAIASILSVVTAPLLGSMAIGTLVRGYWRAALLGGVGLFLTYVGFNFLYTRFGTVPYVVYAALAILTTTVGVGMLYLKEPVNTYHLAAVLFALASIALFSLGQAHR
jgi:drug/metabolite transporter (DMT)-like permease